MAGMGQHFMRHGAKGYSDFGDEHLDNWAMLVAGFLITLMEELGLTNVEQLLVHVRATKVYEEGASVSETEATICREFARRSGTLFPSNLSVSPPNSVAAFLQWRVLTAALAMLTEACR